MVALGAAEITYSSGVHWSSDYSITSPMINIRSNFPRTLDLLYDASCESVSISTFFLRMLPFSVLLTTHKGVVSVEHSNNLITPTAPP